MKPLRLALFFILLIFHAILVVLSLNFTQSMADSIVRNPTAFRFLTFFGLAVFLVTFAFGWFDRRAAHKRIEKLEAEKNAIKAEVFDREKRAQAREQEIEREINSFKASLPPSESAKTEPALSEHQDDAYREEPPLAEPPPLLETEATEPQTNDPDQVAYGPLTPKYPLSDEEEDTDTTNPPRS